MYKIFFKERIIILAPNKMLNDFISVEKRYLFRNQEQLDLIIKEFREFEFFQQIAVFSHNIKELLAAFEKSFEIVNAAGGLVLNSEKQLLVILRKGKWDLPKGKVDENESITHAALREVNEETGVNKLEIVQELPTTYHAYIENQKWVLKKTFWFEMRANYKKPLQPQMEESITIAKWVSNKEVTPLLYNTYLSLKELFLWFKAKKEFKFIQT